MSDTQDNMIVDSEDAPSQRIDRAGKRVFRKLGACQEKESVLLRSGGFTVANYQLADQVQTTLLRS